jgi:dipeptidyl aminopeptidase/acylaminoacyl peptidase
MLDLGALLRVPCVETEMGFDLSPDGGKVALAWNPHGQWEIFELDLQAGASPRQISSGPGGKFHPRYSPDGRSLAYAVDFDGSEFHHILVRDLASGNEIDLTPDLQASVQPFFDWSPDGKNLAYISDVSGEFDVYLVPRLGGEARLLFAPGYPAWKVTFSPDGSWLAVECEAEGQDYALFVYPIRGGHPVRMQLDGTPINAKDAAWSPDGRRLAFSSDVSGHYQIGIYDLPAQRLEWITSGDGQKHHPAWSPDGKRLVYILTRGALSWLAQQHPAEEPELHCVEPGVHSLPRFARDGKSILFVFDNPRHPCDLWSLTLAGESCQRTHSLPPGIPPSESLMPTEITYPGLDGASVPALLFRPESGTAGPAVLLVHGGPDWHFECTWYPVMAAMASRGWVVLVTNYRGSTGYGRLWQRASRFDYGGVDCDDVAAGALYLAREGLADPRRIALTGRSHGGYLTACCLTRYPELWAAGSAVVPFLNWFTNHEEIRPDLQHWDLENFGDPVKDRSLWIERSPSFFLNRVQAPLQLICGALDARCPVRDSLEAHAELRRLGKEVELLLYEDEGHSFLKRENVLDAETRRLSFLAKHLE